MAGGLDVGIRFRTFVIAFLSSGGLTCVGQAFFEGITGLHSIYVYHPKVKIECKTVDRFRMPFVFL